MKMVEMIIRIPEEAMARLALGVTYMQDIQSVCNAINEGTILPNEHGRLIDADIVCNEFEGKSFGTSSDYRYAIEAVEDTPTILEANKEVENAHN